MVTQMEEPQNLVGLKKICPTCEMNFHFCASCWRGQRYCSRECSQEGRRRNRRLTEMRYVATEKGRLSRRRRQKNFRIRRILAPRVTDHSPQTAPTVIRRSSNLVGNASKRCFCCKRPIRIIVDGGQFAHSEKSNYFSFTRIKS